MKVDLEPNWLECIKLTVLYEEEAVSLDALYAFAKNFDQIQVVMCWEMHDRGASVREREPCLLLENFIADFHSVECELPVEAA